MNLYKYIPFIVTIVVSLGVFVFLFTENDRLRKEIIILELTTSRQQEEIKRQRIELESYVCDLESMRAYAIKEYERAFAKTKDDKTCEGKLKHLENILKSYEE